MEKLEVNFIKPFRSNIGLYRIVSRCSSVVQSEQGARCVHTWLHRIARTGKPSSHFPWRGVHFMTLKCALLCSIFFLIPTPIKGRGACLKTMYLFVKWNLKAKPQTRRRQCCVLWGPRYKWPLFRWNSTWPLQPPIQPTKTFKSIFPNEQRVI
jgi:hypothetical protein